MAVQFPLVNGVRHSWTSVECKLAGGVVAGITEFNYSPKLEAATVRGAGPLPIGTTTGLASYTADFTILLEEFNQFVTTLGPAWMTAFFDFEISYSDEGYAAAGLSTITDSVRRCRITEVGAAASNGSGDATVRKVTLLPLEMYLNGVSPMPNQPSLSIGGLAGAGVNVARRIIGF